MSLERTRVGVFGKEDAMTLSEIQNLKDMDRLNECVKSVDSLFMDLPAITVKKEVLSKLENGNILNMVDITTDNTVNVHGRVRAYKTDGTFSALYRYESDSDIFRPEKMFL